MVDPKKSKLFSGTTNFGNFWLRHLKGDLTLTLTMDKDRKKETLRNIVTNNNLSLDDIPMAPQ